MITDKKKLVDALMEHASDSADRYSSNCWSIYSEEVENFDSKEKLRSAVTKFVNWLDKLEK